MVVRKVTSRSLLGGGWMDPSCPRFGLPLPAARCALSSALRFTWNLLPVFPWALGIDSGVWSPTTTRKEAGAAERAKAGFSVGYWAH